MKKVGYFLILLLPCLLFVNGLVLASDPLKDIADTLTPEDAVTGRRTLNIESDEEEIRRATNQTAQLLSAWRSRGVPIDFDQKLMDDLQQTMKKIAEVSHRPELPWGVYLIGSKDINAFTIGGGKLFFYHGLFGGLVKNRIELAAVMAHEIAHVNCRHMGKSSSERLISTFSKSTKNKIFQASFTTIQEDEADRVGLLYMALAGYDPKVVPQIWKRAHEKYGSSSGDYAYDHSLNIDRFRKVSDLVPIALKYFRGNGIRNENYTKLKVENDLIPRTTSEGSGLLALLQGVSGSTVDYFNTKTEQHQREALKAQDQRLISQNIRVLGVKIANTQDGHRGVFFKLRNIGNSMIRSTIVTIHYLDGTGKSIYSENVQTSALSPNSTQEFGTYLKAIPGMQRVKADVTNISFTQ